MIYVSVSRRLGNQLFYYAIARKLQLNSRAGEELCFSFHNVLESGKKEPDEQGFEDSLKFFKTHPYIVNNQALPDLLENFAGRIQKRVAWKQIDREYKLEKHIMNKNNQRVLKLFSLLGNVVGLYFYPHCINEFFSEVYLLNSLFVRNKFISGRFENPEWFNDIKDILKDEIVPKEPPRKENERLYKVIEETNSVCISIRRGDYLLPKWNGCFTVCDLNYFKKAIEYINAHIINPTFIIFSDDIEWAKACGLFNENDNYYFESGNDPVWEKLRLMYNCKHYIISNSTFSWWA